MLPFAYFVIPGRYHTIHLYIVNTLFIYHFNESLYIESLYD